ncbi:MAG: ABC transporter substrate-binding protein [Rhodospirillales bacterium]|nr:ABC transporter substrate-binding protein [Rhodospirillales bacterium]
MFTRRKLLGTSLALASAPLIASAVPAAAQSANLKIAIDNSPNNMDPLKHTIASEYIYANLVFNGLTRMREDLVLEPDLAESWSFSGDLKQWTFKLRSGVKFHNGRVFEAADVVTVFQRVLDPANASPARSNFDMIEKIEAPDATTAVFTLKYPYGGFADILSDRQVKITPRDALGGFATKPVGTGPFTFVSYTPGDRMVLAKNPTYFEAGLPKVAGVELRIIPEMAVRLAALDAGDVDIVWDVPLDQVKTLQGKPNIRAESVPTPSWDAAVMNNAIPPFNDKRVRRAFHLAVDKRDVAEIALFGQGEPTHSPIPPSHPFYAKDIPIPKADPAAAKKLLAEAGHPNGIKIQLIVPVGRPIRERAGVAMQQLAKAGGFDIEIKRVPFSSFEAEVLGKAPFWVDGFFGRPTIDTSTYPFLHTGTSFNNILWKYSNPEVDKALSTARQTGDVAEQKKQYLAMQKAMSEDPPGFFCYSVNFACAYRQSVKGVKTHPSRWFDLRNATLG